MPRKKDKRVGGIPKYLKPHGSFKTPKKQKRGANWERTQSEFANRRKKWKRMPASKKRGMTLHEDYSWGKKK